MISKKLLNYGKLFLLKLKRKKFEYYDYFLKLELTTKSFEPEV
jgi:hypothetical protein